jgi:hypothetical protein
MCRRLGLGHWNQVSFLAVTDFASGSAGSDGSRMTLSEPLSRLLPPEPAGRTVTTHLGANVHHWLRSERTYRFVGCKFRDM